METLSVDLYIEISKYQSSLWKLFCLSIPWLGRSSLNIQEKVKSQLGKWIERNFGRYDKTKAFVLPNGWLHGKCYTSYSKEYTFHNDKLNGEYRIRRNKFYVYKDDYVRTVLHEYKGKVIKEEHYDENGLAEGTHMKWDKKGQPIYEMSYHEGHLWGDFKIFNSKGEIIEDIDYKKGRSIFKDKVKRKSFKKSNLKQDFKVKLRLVPGPRQPRIGFYHAMAIALERNERERLIKDTLIKLSFIMAAFIFLSEVSRKPKASQG